MAQLPQCEFRVKTGRRNVYYCRHSRVHTSRDLVTPSICRSCGMRDVPCNEPRPLLDDLENANEPDNAAFPSRLSQAWNLTKSLAAFVADGLSTVDAAEYETRLGVCDSCDERVGNRCRQCGCNLTLKACGRAFQCPLGKWETGDNSADC